MQLTDHMRNQLLEGVLAAKSRPNPLLEGIDLNRLQKTLERDLTEDELASLMIAVGMDPAESMRALSLSIIDRKIAASPTRNEDPAVPDPTPMRSWRVPSPDHGGPLLTRHVHRPWKTLMKSTVSR